VQDDANSVVGWFEDRRPFDNERFATSALPRPTSPPVLGLCTRLAALVDAASRLRSRWLNVPTADVDELLLQFEHDIADVLTHVVRVADGVAGNGNGASAVANARLERDLARLDREVAARDRETAALSWHRSAQLRHAAKADRDRAALLRHEASLERDAFRTDDVTGALERRPGLAALERELERCRRGDGRMVVGFIDVDGLKAVNDTQGHRAGDRLLHEVAAALKASLRPYDVVVRYGGDEFVYSLAGVTPEAAHGRFKHMATALSRATGGATVSVGLAEVRPHDTLSTVIARADADLYARRGQLHLVKDAARPGARSVPAPALGPGR
jgi:diguanylate cyclase (GGDEF)-like protein